MREQEEIEALEAEQEETVQARQQQTVFPLAIACKICLNERISNMILPCFHVCVCDTCAGVLNSNQSSSCPICLCYVQSIQKIYIP